MDSDTRADEDYNQIKVRMEDGDVNFHGWKEASWVTHRRSESVIPKTAFRNEPPRRNLIKS